jgi:hypothetical protein
MNEFIIFIYMNSSVRNEGPMRLQLQNSDSLLRCDNEPSCGTGRMARHEDGQTDFQLHSDLK